MEKLYSIAGLTVRMNCCGRSEKQGEAYRCWDHTEPDVSISREEIEEHISLRREKYPTENEEIREYLSTGFVFYRHLLEFDGLMLHSSAVVVDGRAYVFAADPGTGKSTHTGLWLKLFGDRAFILNDDKPALRLEDGVWYAYGTPWSGKHDISRNVRVPLAGIAVLERGEENSIVPFGGISAIQAIIKQVNRPKAAQHRVLLMKLLDKLITQVPIWKLRCNMEPEAAELAYQTMSGTKTDGKEEC